MENEELAKAVLLTLQQTAALEDVLDIICGQLLNDQPQQSAKIASLLEGLVDNPNLEVTQPFALLSTRLAKTFRGDIDQPFLSLQKRPASESGLEALQELMKKLKK